MKLVGLTGRARCGKNSVYDFLNEKHGCAQFQFAGALKSAAAILLNKRKSQVEGLGYDREKIMPEWGFSMREFLQKLGTECIRGTFREDFWINRVAIELDQMIKVYERAEAEMPGVVFTDVRFENEADFVRQRGGIIWHVIRPDVDRFLDEHAQSHASEAGVEFKAGDVYVQNNGSLEDLRDRVLKLWEMKLWVT